MITVFTPTHNRAYILPQLYQALQRQKSMEFEWLIIDDDSTDETEKLVGGWIKENNSFDIRYYKQARGGKHGAWNRANNLATYEGILCIDSDDYPTEDCVELMERWFRTIENEPDIVGVAALRGESKDIPLDRECGVFNGDYIDLPQINHLLRQYSLDKDKSTIYKKKILQRYPFPEYPGEFRCCPESVIKEKMALDGYRTRWINEVTQIARYREDGITRADIFELWGNSPNNYIDYYEIGCQVGDIDESVLSHSKNMILANLVCRFGCEVAHKRLLGRISNCEQQIATWRESINCLTMYLHNNANAGYAIYGLGMVGKMFYQLSKQIGIEPDFGIDRSIKKLESLKIYKPYDEFPKVDTVVVCLMEYDKSINQFLEDRDVNYCYWRDLAEELWNYWVD